MKLTVNKSDIIDVLSRIQGLSSRRTNLGITSCVLIRAAEAEITVVATDLETGFEGYYPAVVEIEGAMAINARKLFEIVKEFPSEQIAINEVDNHWFEIGNQKVQFHIVGMDPEDFPDIPRIDAVDFFKIDSLAFKKMVEKSMVIGETDDKRAHLMGAFLERVESVEGQVLRMVSTDGSRLSTVDHPFARNEPLALGDGLLIPKKGLIEVNRFLEPQGVVQVGFKESHFVVKKEIETVIIRLLDGEFPKYGEIVREREGHRIPFVKNRLLPTLKRMSILTSDEYRGVIFKFSEGSLVITSTNPDIGESKEEMEIEFSGEPIEAAFNPKFFIDAVNNVEDEKVMVEIVDEENPCLIRGSSDRSFLSVIMPMRM